MRRAGIGALIGVVVTLAGAESAAACSCAPLELDRQTFRQNDGAIVGRLLDKTPVGRFSADYRYRVTAVYRGRRLIDVGAAIEIRSAADGAACGLETAPGKKDGLFLERRRGRWTSSLCATVSPQKLRRAAADRGRARAATC